MAMSHVRTEIKLISFKLSVGMQKIGMYVNVLELFYSFLQSRIQFHIFFFRILIHNGWTTSHWNTRQFVYCLYEFVQKEW